MAPKARSLLVELLALGLAGCCGNRYTVVQPASLSSYDAVAVGDVVVLNEGSMSPRTREKARTLANELRADFADRFTRPGSRTLLVRGELEYSPKAPFVQGKARIHAIFVDTATQQVIARAFVESGAEEAGWGCSTHSILAGGVAEFVDDNR